jgi:anti-sigma regulatory factor (Ser/Thr protein kinase)
MQRSFRKEIQALEDVFQFTSEFTAKNQLSDNVSFAMNLAIEELFINIVKYTTDSGNDISIHLGISAGDLVVKITDFDVERFDITQAKKADLDKALSERKIGGIGLHLVRNFVDKITYEYENRTACITLVKRLEAPNV